LDRTRVYFTVDTEAAEERVVGERMIPAQGYDLRVWCRFRNRQEELGIALILRELGVYGYEGTFFLEVFGSFFFGIDGLRAITKRLRDAGHDVQLHTHPRQRNAGYRSKGDAPAPDDLAAYDVDTQVALLREGIDVLTSAGVPREDIVSMRAGNFGANNDTWEAMKRAGLPLSSSYNPGYFHKNCAMRSPAARAGLFEAIPGVWELPITNFREAGRGTRHLQITAVSSIEMQAAMLEARAMGAREVCIVTHSFEFCHIDSVEEQIGRPNTINVHRLRALCRFLAENSDEFEVDTCGALGKRLAAGEERPRATTPTEHPNGSAARRARRLVAQAFKRVESGMRIVMPSVSKGR
jgi:hypothetical protein